jgi:DNA-binding NarL/FixJ family response regulator
VSVRVLIADDQALVRAGFRMILDGEEEVEVLAEAADGLQAVELAGRLRPDVVLMDIRMPRLDGIEATRRILAGPGTVTRILILTTYDLDEYVYEALQAGAAGFLLKDVPPEQLVAAVHVIARGDALLAPSVTRRLIQEFARRPARTAGCRLLDGLTVREREVLLLMARGLSNGEISTRLFLGETTVKTHVARVLQKLEVRDRVQAVVAAYENGLVQPGATEI